MCHEEARGFLFLGDCVFYNYVGDEGRPLEAGLQEQASNHLKLLWLRAMVVSVEEKSQR